MKNQRNQLLLTGSVIIALTWATVARDANTVKVRTQTIVPRVGKGGSNTANTTNSPYKIKR